MLIHPAKNFEAGHRYAVAMRKLRTAPARSSRRRRASATCATALPVKDPVVKAQRKRFDKVFRDLRKAKIKRRNLYLAWDFTVSSDENIAGRMLHIRDDAFAQLGDTDLADVQVQGGAPSFNGHLGRELHPGPGPGAGAPDPGHLRGALLPGAQLRAGRPLRSSAANGLPEPERHLHGASSTAASPTPRSTRPAPMPGRPQVYGHGLLGSASQATSSDQQILGQTHNFVICATTTIGFSSGDLSNIVDENRSEPLELPGAD